MDIEYEKYNSCVRRYNNLLCEINNEYNNYVIKHENKLRDIQNNIDEINKVKPVFKYILEKLSRELREMGVDSTVSDYPMEKIDYRKFNIDEEYNLIHQEKLKLDKTLSLNDEYKTYFDAYKFYQEDLLGKAIYAITNAIIKPATGYVVVKSTDWIYAYFEERKINKLLPKQKLIREKISSDLEKLDRLKDSLSHIADIYRIIKEALDEKMETIIRNIEKKYHNKYKEIPSNVLQMMHSSSKIFKELSEKRILPEKSSIVNIEDVCMFEKQLSKLKYDIEENLNTYNKVLTQINSRA